MASAMTASHLQGKPKLSPCTPELKSPPVRRTNFPLHPRRCPQEKRRAGGSAVSYDALRSTHPTADVDLYRRRSRLYWRRRCHRVGIPSAVPRHPDLCDRHLPDPRGHLRPRAPHRPLRARKKRNTRRSPARPRSPRPHNRFLRRANQHRRQRPPRNRRTLPQEPPPRRTPPAETFGKNCGVSGAARRRQRHRKGRARKRTRRPPLHRERPPRIHLR